MRDFCDGELFKPGHHPLFSVNNKAVQILLYYDDFEVANPLGAKATVHKLGIYAIHNVIYVNPCAMGCFRKATQRDLTGVNFQVDHIGLR